MDLTEETLAELAPLFAQVANDVRRTNPLVDREDLLQECALWCATHPAKLTEFLNDEDERRGDRMLYVALRNACRKYARKDKADRLGYSPDDEAFYRVLVLKDELLPAVYDENAWLPSTEQRENVRGGGDPAHGNERVATLADVSAAVSRLDKLDRSLLEMYYRDGLMQDQMAVRIGTSQATVSRWLERAVRNVHKELGGSRPYDDPPEGSAVEPVGSRRAMSNAQARYITSMQMGFEKPGERDA